MICRAYFTTLNAPSPSTAPNTRSWKRSSGSSEGETAACTVRQSCCRAASSSSAVRGAVSGKHRWIKFKIRARPSPPASVIVSADGSPSVTRRTESRDEMINRQRKYPFWFGRTCFACLRLCQHSRLPGFLNGASECIRRRTRPARCGVERSRRNPISRHGGGGITHRCGSNGTKRAVACGGSTSAGVIEHGPRSHAGNGHRRWVALVKRPHHSGDSTT